MQACNEWGISVSIRKSKFGVRTVEYLGPKVSAEGLQNYPKNLDALRNLAFEFAEGCSVILGIPELL